MEVGSCSHLPSREAAGKSPPLAADTKVDNCFSQYSNSEIIEHKNDDF